MGIIPRKLKFIKGFVEWSHGILPFEDSNDEKKLRVYVALVDRAVREGRMRFTKTSYVPIVFNVKKEEMEAFQLIFAHTQKNIEEVYKIEKKREAMGY